jgi:hypothetical protein
MSMGRFVPTAGGKEMAIRGRVSAFAGFLAYSLLGGAAVSIEAAELRGNYLEARTCQVYTGPCFANGEAGLTGKSAMMAWSIEEGAFAGVDLAGLKIVVVVQATDTLGFGGLEDPRELRSVVLVDERASREQREALLKFAQAYAGRAGDAVVRVDAVKIDLLLDTAGLRGELSAGKVARLVTRAARPGDCICSNETAYYPPLAAVDYFAAGVAEEAYFAGRGLADRWSIPGSRSAYMAQFAY